MGCVSYLSGCFGSWAQEHGSKAIAACGWSKPSDQRLGACSCIHAASRVRRHCVWTAERLNGTGEHCCDELRLVNRRRTWDSGGRKQASLGGTALPYLLALSRDIKGCRGSPKQKSLSSRQHTICIPFLRGCCCKSIVSPTSSSNLLRGGARHARMIPVKDCAVPKCGDLKLLKMRRGRQSQVCFCGLEMMGRADTMLEPTHQRGSSLQHGHLGPAARSTDAETEHN
jgi:hypothetical protein